MAVIKPNGDLTGTLAYWFTFGSGADQSARLADSDDGTGIALDVGASSGDVLVYELESPASLDTAQPVTIRIKAAAEGSSGACRIDVALLDPTDPDTICDIQLEYTASASPTFGWQTYTLSGAEALTINNPTTLRIQIDQATWTGAVPIGTKQFSMSEIEIEYVGSGGGAVRRSMLPMLGVG